METTRETFHDLSFFFLLILAALAVDGLLHLAGHPEWGRYFGYVGTVLLLISFLHSARKRKLIQSGSPPFFLRLHELLSWLGATMILIHGGIHFRAILPWLAMLAMLVVVASGLTGKYLLRRSRAMVEERKKALQTEGMTQSEIENQLYWDSLVVDLMKKWRVVHIPLTLTFAILALLHVISVFLFWTWQS